jgi:hypothetical protein
MMAHRRSVDGRDGTWLDFDPGMVRFSNEYRLRSRFIFASLSRISAFSELGFSAADN